VFLTLVLLGLCHLRPVALRQGRYRAIVLQNEGVWVRVPDYIQLNPVRAGVVSIEQAANFRWSSLADFSKNHKFNGLDPTAWMLTLGLDDSAGGWLNYVDRLTWNFDPSAEAVARLRQELSRVWVFRRDRLIGPSTFLPRTP
jgi:putative transposase